MRGGDHRGDGEREQKGCLGRVPLGAVPQWVRAGAGGDVDRDHDCRWGASEAYTEARDGQDTTEDWWYKGSKGEASMIVHGERSALLITLREYANTSVRVL